MEFTIFLVAFIVTFIWILIPGMTSSLGVSSMVLLGVPIQLSKTTFQIGVLWGNMMGFLALYKKQKVNRSLIILLMWTALIGGYIWSNILVTISTPILFRLTWLFLILVLLAQIYSKDLGVIEKELTHGRKFFGVLLYALLYIFYSVFPMGAGAIFHAVDTTVFRITILQSRILTGYSAIPFLIGFLLPVITTWTYNIYYILMYGLWSGIGWYLWARSWLKLGNIWLKKIIMLWLFCLGIYFLFFAKV
jgi:uncharacterized membrane protein YfcA